MQRTGLRCFGLMKRMEVNQMHRKMEELVIRRKIPRGRVRSRWMDEIKRDVEKRGIYW